jgi:hypothetical protein
VVVPEKALEFVLKCLFNFFKVAKDSTLIVIQRIPGTNTANITLEVVKKIKTAAT